MKFSVHLKENKLLEAAHTARLWPVLSAQHRIRQLGLSGRLGRNQLCDVVALDITTALNRLLRSLKHNQKMSSVHICNTLLTRLKPAVLQNGEVCISVAYLYVRLVTLQSFTGIYT
jgi:hypothetical protein